jgi:hypothetical protein
MAVLPCSDVEKMQSWCMRRTVDLRVSVVEKIRLCSGLYESNAEPYWLL